jgi:hypothetical protein
LESFHKKVKGSDYMAYQDGWAAINLEMPSRIPRFEPSAAEYHWDLVKIVTGIEVSEYSSENIKLLARQAFLQEWDYGIYFGALISHDELNACRTTMGHAEYAYAGNDLDTSKVCPFNSVEEVLNFDPWEAYGTKDHGELVRRFQEHYQAEKLKYPDTVTTTGVYVTLMSGMISIFGWDMLLLAAGTDSVRFGQMVNRYAGWMQQYYNAMAECDAKVIYSHDDLVWSTGPFMRPAWYREYIFPNLKKLWAPLVESGKKIIFICDGNYTRFAEDIAACGNAGFWFEIFTDLKYMTERFGKTHVLLGNSDSRILTFGSKVEIYAEVERCMEAGKPCPGYFMCTSGHIPPNVPVENALYYNEIYNKLRQRK